MAAQIQDPSVVNLWYEEDISGKPVGLVVQDWIPCKVPSMTILEGNHCRLLPPSIDHLDELADAFGIEKGDAECAELWTWLPFGPFETKADFSTWMSSEMINSTTAQFYSVQDAKTYKLVGVASYLRITPKMGSIEIGNLVFSPLMQRSCISTETIFLMLCDVFEAGYRRCEWKCNTLNAKSRTAAERFGFSFEGVFRNSLVVKGRNRDTAWYAMTDEDFGGIRRDYEQWLSATNFDKNGNQKCSLSFLTSHILVQRFKDSNYMIRAANTKEKHEKIKKQRLE